AQALGETTAALYTPRNLTALMATLRAVETAVPASPARDVLLLCVLEILISGSRLNTLAGRGTPLRIEKGRARRSHASQWREANVWLEFDRTVRELVAWLAQHPSPARPRSATLALDTGDADLVLCQAPVEDALGGWSAVAAVALLGMRGAKPADAGDGRVVGRERLLRTMRAALIDGHRGSRPEAPAAVYVPHADLASIAAVALAGAGAGYRLRGIPYPRDALTTGAASGSGAAAAGHPHDTPVYSLAEPVDATQLDDRLEWGMWGLLSASRDIETRTLLRRAYGLFRDVETPDRELIERCIAAYGHQSDDGRWRLRDEDALVRRQADQTLLAIQLLDAGRRLGFKVHVGRDLERRALPEAHLDRGAVLGDLMTDAERTDDISRVARIHSDALEYVDCLWYDKGNMVFLWQLEWTARLHRSVIALGEAVPDEDRVFRFFAIADERRSLAEFKLRRAAATADVVRRRGWRFVKWGPLRSWATRRSEER